MAEVAAIGWGVSAVGWFVSPYITRLLDKAYAYLKPGKSREKIRFMVNHTIPKLKLILEAAEGSEHKPLFEELLTDLRSAFYATEDILDEIEYLRRHQSGTKRKLDSCFDEGPSNQDVGTLSSLTIPGPLSNLLKENVTKIEELVKQAHTTIDSANLQSNKDSKTHIFNATRSNINPTFSKPIGEVTGREKVLEELTEMLRRPSSSGSTCLSIIGIVGIPGSGKTTLAQCLCVAEKKTHYFDLVMWIHVSEIFTVHSIYTEMFEQAWKKSSGHEVRPQYNSLDKMREELEKVLCGKRILLVLDDIWFNKEEAAGDQKLQQLLLPLRDGKEGSKILVTSRQDSLSRLGPDVTTIKYQIPDLDDEVFFKLFMHYAINNKPVDKEDKGKLEQIGAQISQKLKKSPLLARVVGGILFRKPTVEVRDWLSVRDQNLLDKYMGPLWWSYQHLGEQVKRCFAYCSIFPRTHLFRRVELVNLWVAEGFVNTTNIGHEMEYVGQCYFDELVSCSYLLAGGEDFFGEYFLIHDLLYDLSVKVAGSDCFKVENGWTGKNFADVRHISIENCNISMITGHILNLKNLRTLIIYDCQQDISEQAFEDMFRMLSKLRVLIIRSGGYGPELLFPKSISYLKHLRYLGIQMMRPRTPSFEDIHKLYLLQVLEWIPDRNLRVTIGEDTIKLLDLRHVFSRSVFFPNIGRMTSLLTIPALDLSEGKGYELHQLKHLNKLQGKLEITGLEYVKSMEEAAEAKLADKEGLTKLKLKWWFDELLDDIPIVECSPDLQEDILEGLCPPKYLKHLTIGYYKSYRYPSWMVGKQKSTMHLHRIKLRYCRQPFCSPEDFFLPVSSLVLHCCSNWETLPYNMEDLTSLEFVFCSPLPWNLEYLTSLKTLIIKWDADVIKWDADVIDEDDEYFLLPTLPKSLDYINISGWDSLLERDYNNWEMIKHIPRIVLNGKECTEQPLHVDLDEGDSEALLLYDGTGNTTDSEWGSGADPTDGDSDAMGSYRSADSRTDSEERAWGSETDENSEGSGGGAAR